MPGTGRTVSIIGLGYIGLPTAAVLASRGVSVIGVDINASAVQAINEGRAHFFEPELDSLVTAAVTGGRLRAVTRPEAAEAFIIAVPTPVSEGHTPDLTYVDAAARSIAPVLRRGNLVVLESTSPVGTTERLSRLLAEQRPDLRFPHSAGDKADIRLAYCPERILPGRMITELVENDRIIGGLSPACTASAEALYHVFVKGALVRTSARCAEMVKLTENAFRDVNIAFANELSKVCDRLGIDVWETIALANHHPRVNILKPGPGVGGHCIAVDPWFIIHSAPDLTPLMRSAREVNDSKPDYVTEQVLERMPQRATVACFGLSYKADTDDLRESPAVDVVDRLASHVDHEILVVEPNIDRLPERLLGRGIRLCSIDEALAQADMAVLLVDHAAFREIDHARLADLILYDTRGVWPEGRMTPSRPALVAAAS